MTDALYSREFETNETDEMTPIHLPPAIEVRGLTKRFGEVTAVNDVSFSVQPGELFFLLGPSGCGKTTLLRILAGLETPDAGTVLFGGQDVTAMPPHKRGAPMVFQNYALWPHMTVFDNVAFGLVEQGVPHREMAERVFAALDQVELEGLHQRRPGELSGGQQQRVVLARALVMEPAVVLLDEPLSNLDAKLRSEMRAEIERLHEETNITFIYVTHDQVEALSLADRMAVMDAGRLRSLGAPAELYHRPPESFTAEFLGEANWFDGTVKELEDGLLRVETLHGMWNAVSASPEVPEPGTRVRCMVRPENIDLLRRTPRDSINYLEATVESSRMNGSTVTVRLAAQGGKARATLLNRPGLTLAPGRSLAWGVLPEHTVVLPE